MQRPSLMPVLAFIRLTFSPIHHCTVPREIIDFSPLRSKTAIDFIQHTCTSHIGPLPMGIFSSKAVPIKGKEKKKSKKREEGGRGKSQVQNKIG